MEQIIKVTVIISQKISGIEKHVIHYFYNIKDAKRWCKDCKNERNNVIKFPEYRDTVSYSFEPVTITVLDEDDGEL